MIKRSNIKKLDKKYRSHSFKLKKQRVISSIKDLSFFSYFENKKINRMIKENYAPDISTITENIAFVIDNQVVEIIHCQEKMASILLSNPKIIRIPQGEFPKIGSKYIDNKFVDNV